MDGTTYTRMMTLFLDEARQQLRAMDEALPALKRVPGDTVARLVLQRAAHSLRGNALAMELEALADDAQGIEEITMVPLSPVTLAMVSGARAAIGRALDELVRRVA